MSGTVDSSRGVGAWLSLLAFVPIAGLVTFVAVVFTGWTNEVCAPGAFACDDVAVATVRWLIGAGFAVGVALGVVGVVRSARRGRGVVWALLAWPVWSACLVVGDAIATR